MHPQHAQSAPPLICSSTLATNPRIDPARVSVRGASYLVLFWSSPSGSARRSRRSLRSRRPQSFVSFPSTMGEPSRDGERFPGQGDDDTPGASLGPRFDMSSEESSDDEGYVLPLFLVS